MEHFPLFIEEHWQQFFMLVLILIAIIIMEIRAQRESARTLSPQELIAILNQGKAVIIDIRDNALYKKGHIINALSMKAADLEKKEMKKYHNKQVILICDKGDLSKKLTTHLSGLGYLHPMALSGGIDAWVSSGFPLIKEEKA